jgi:hypothetical protein
METTLHRQLKQQYAGDDSQTEVRIGSFRIDAVRDDELIEIQHGSLAAIRDKVERLLANGHPLRIVKPMIARRLLVRLARKSGREVSRRYSPKKCTLFDIFHELIYFTRVFPHPGLILEVPLIHVEEWRYPGHGRRRWRRENDFQVQDQFLGKTIANHEFRTAHDMTRILPTNLPIPFHTGQLAESLGINRSTAQRVTYCLRNFGSITQVGKQGNALLYQIASSRKQRRRRA